MTVLLLLKSRRGFSVEELVLTIERRTACSLRYLSSGRRNRRVRQTTGEEPTPFCAATRASAAAIIALKRGSRLDRSHERSDACLVAASVGNEHIGHT